MHDTQAMTRQQQRITARHRAHRSRGITLSLDDDEFIVPEDPVEQERFKRRLIATANSLKEKQQQLQADQDLLADRWTEVLAAEEYELEHPSKSYPKRRLLP